MTWLLLKYYGENWRNIENLVFNTYLNLNNDDDDQQENDILCETIGKMIKMFRICTYKVTGIIL